MARTYLGTIEIAVLAALEQRGETFGRDLLFDVEDRIERTLGIGALHVILERLIERGHLTSRRGESSAHGGPPRRYYRITPSGKATRRKELEKITRAASVK